MKLSRQGIPLVVAAVLVLSAFAWWRSDGAAPTEPAPVPVAQTQPAPLASAVPTAVRAVDTAPALPAVTRSASAAAAAQAPRVDVSKFQRDVQQAVSSDEPGLAGKAAQELAACEGLEKERDRMQASMEARQRTEPRSNYREAVTGMEQFFAGCQALDAAARAQLLPLLRRSLQEGDRGAGVALARQLGSDFDPAREPEAMASLRRDAWACDRSSISTLSLLSSRHPQLLTPNEQGAMRQMQRSSPMARALADGQPAQRALMERRFKLPADADPAEVARLAATIQAQCKDD
ncbi:hypothetical protein [Roseateles sp.]|uniref:hypothetical protein n=1 Tax=Roseateles sp. TaxID=1971397 RepID=UPI003262F28C